MTRDEIKKWMLESSGFPVTQANVEYLERFQAIAFQAGAASRDAEIAKLKHQRDYWKEQRDSSAAYGRDLRDQLRAQINVLLEVLDKAGKHVRPTCFDLYDEIAATLASTTEQSLAEYRNKVIEECASVCDKRSMRKNDGNWTDFEWDSICGTNELAADEIRAMKE